MKDTAREGVWEESAGRLRRLLGAEERRDEAPFAALLDLLVWGSKFQNEVREIEADAAPTSTAEPQAEEARVAREELAAARADLPRFERALLEAWQRSGGTDRELAYDAADPARDAAADVLIRYLVTTHMASVRSEERAPEQYIYHVAVYWDALFVVADYLNIPLRAALEQEAVSG